MKRLKKLFVSLLLAISLVIPTTALPFDKEATPLKEFVGVEYPNVTESVVDVRVSGTAYGFWLDMATDKIHIGLGTFSQNGSGFLVSGKNTGKPFVVTAAHVVCPDQVEIRTWKYGAQVAPLAWVKNMVIKIGEGVLARIFYVDQIHDIAILDFEYGLGYLKPLPYDTMRTLTSTPSGTSDFIHRDDAVAVITKHRDENGEKDFWNEIRIDNIVSERVALPPGVSTDNLTWFSMTHFTIGSKVYPGDSGSPVIAWYNKKPYIIGVAVAIAWNSLGECRYYATRIDSVMLFLEVY